ncbi:uncharacterized protein KD926_000271 [Aspergillus affinis]|uniref:uncharacterized protein n=1 Tax=Aspergillus affinis TaxID=1070780 RepID=UPI0022FE345D|nr:uncharacterized protein KD926_000271 [Aspergillus affinis]KAI9037477.1 hypothetical protein KD926_000271 [Aspergillus affinis]
MPTGGSLDPILTNQNVPPHREVPWFQEVTDMAPSLTTITSPIKAANSSSSSHIRMMAEGACNFCEECDHIIKIHESATGHQNIASNHDLGPPISNTIQEQDFPPDHLCPRQDTVSKLIDLIDSFPIIHVRGTPASGKTVLAMLLCDALKKRGRPVHLLDGWERPLQSFATSPSDPWGAFRNMLLQEFPDVAISYNLGKESVLIVDEAQMSYGDMIFWNKIIKERMDDGLGFKIRICLFCTYGSPRTAVERQEFGYTPRNFGQAQRVTLTPQLGIDSPQIGLFYTKSEFNDVISRIIRYKFIESFTLNNDAKRYLFSLTAGQPGGLESVMSYIYKEYRHALKHREISVISEQHVVDCIERDENSTFRHLIVCSVGRSFVPREALAPDVARILSNIVAEQSIPWNGAPALRTCYSNGWIYRMLTNDDCEEVAIFPSRLQAKWVEHIIGNQRSPLPPRYTNLRQLCLEILIRFSVMNLKHSTEGKKLSNAALPRPVEAQYQDEFYRVSCDVAGRGVPISSEWSSTSSSRVDFWIPEKKWAIELLRDYDRVEDHLRRFRNGGKYYEWLENRAVVDYIVINCATTRPTPAQANPDPNLIHAIFENDYKEVQMFCHDGTPLGSAIRLTN